MIMISGAPRPRPEYCEKPMRADPPESVCYDSTDRKSFPMCEGVRLTVPNIVEDRRLRSWATKGYSLIDCYKNAGIPALIPEEVGLHACIRDALKTKYRNPDSGEDEPLPAGNYTCFQYWTCFSDFIKAHRSQPSEGRIQIAENAFCPSLPEQDCIRRYYIKSGSISEAFSACQCSDVYPWWPGGADILKNALDRNIQANIYDVLKASYALYDLIRTTPVTIPITTITNGDAEISGLPTWFYAVLAYIGGSILLGGHE